MCEPCKIGAELRRMYPSASVEYHSQCEDLGCQCQHKVHGAHIQGEEGVSEECPDEP